MDYKSRNPDIKFWPDSTLRTRCKPFPYDSPTNAGLFEIDAPDFSTQFLGLPQHLSEDETYHITYFIEAPSDCPMRRKFEFGEITWKEFWFHRGWVIEYRKEFNGLGHVLYVHPSQMRERPGYWITKFNHLSPMLLKLRSLEERSSFDYRMGDNMAELAEKLAEFCEKYPEILRQKITNSKAA